MPCSPTSASERGRPTSGDERRDLDQRLEEIDAQNAAIPKKSVERGIGARERAGVRARKALARLRAAKLVRDDRFAGSVRRARGARKARGIAHGLEEKQDHLRVRVFRQKPNELAQAEIGLVADGHELGEAKAPRGAARKDRAEHRAALRDETRGARARRIHLKNRVDAERKPAR